MTKIFNQTIRSIAQSFRLMVGLPDYAAYIKHIKSTHPDHPAMSHEELFRERQESRYGVNGKMNRCC